MSVALILLVTQGIGWGLTGSAVLLAVVADSFADVLASGMNLVAVRHATHPPDEEHRYGHGKLEALSGLFQATLLLVSALFLSVESIQQLLAGEAPHAGTLAWTVLGVSLVAKVALVLYQHRVAMGTGSVAVAAELVHYASDVGLYLGALAALALRELGTVGQAEGAFGLLVAVWIVWGASRVAWTASQHLMDRELPESDRERLLGLALSYPGVEGVHELRSRRAGPDLFVQLHLELDGQLTLEVAHGIGDAVRDRIWGAYPGADVLIHTDPVEVQRPRDQGASGERSSPAA